MGVTGGPNMTHTGVVFDMDASVGSGFAGIPTINLLPNPNFANGTTGWSANQNVTLSTASFSDGTYLLELQKIGNRSFRYP